MKIPMWENGSAEKAPPKLSPWDTLVLAGEVIPGKAEVQITRKRATDSRKAPGSEGGTTTDHGNELAEVSVTLTLWTEDQIRALEKVYHLLEPTPAKPKKTLQVEFGPSTIVDLITAPQAPSPLLPSSVSFTDVLTAPVGPAPLQENAPFSPPPVKKPVLTPLSIRHPACAMRRVHSVVVLEVEGPSKGGVAGTMELKLKLREWVKVPKGNVTSTPNAAADITTLPRAIKTDPPEKTDNHP